MRKILTFMTLGAASAGYLYLQMPAPVGEPYYPNRPARSSLNFALSNFGLGSAPQSTAGDLVDRVHERTRTLYNEVSRQQTSAWDQSSDDAFERLRKVMLTTAQSMSAADQGTDEPAADGRKSSRVPEPGSDDLQRAASSSSNDAEQSQLNLISGTQTPSGPTEAEEIRLIPTSADPVAPAVTAAAPVRDDSTFEQPGSETSRSMAVDNPASAVLSTPVATNSTAAAESRRRTVTTLASNRVTKYLVSEWKMVGTSAEGRPMHTMQLGDSGTRTLVIAGLYGDDRTGVHWLELLSDELRRQPELLENNEIMLFRAGNPDGLVRNTPNNSRGIPLNRNFPSRRYRPTPDMPTFAVPASEVETRVIMETLYSFRPRRVIHLGSTANKSQVLYNRAAKSTANDFERGTKLTAQMFDSEQFPGSIEDFADGTLDASVMSLRLAIDNDWKQAWSKFQPHVLAAVVGQASDAGQAVQQQADANQSPLPTAKADMAPRASRRRGYEELPPPPLR